MSVTRVQRTSWFTRIKNAVVGVLLGLVLVPGSVYLLSWNEYRTVHRARGLKEGTKLVSTIEDPSEVRADFENQLVHMTEQADTEEVLRDVQFKVEDVAIKLRRHVEMYQWVETEESDTEHKTGGGTETTTTYEYHQKWVPGRIESEEFEQQVGHENPQEVIHAMTRTAKKVNVGAYVLNDELKSQINSFEVIPWTDEAFANLDDRLKKRAAVEADFLYWSMRGTQGSSTPTVGDQRIRLEIVRPTQVSLVGKQFQGRVTGFKVSNGENIERLYVGAFSAVEIFDKLHSENTLMAWIFRGVGFLMCLIGFALILGPLAVFADVVPFIGMLTRNATGFVALMLAICVSAVTIASAWVVVRPLVGIPLFAVAVLSIVALFGKRKRSSNASPANLESQIPQVEENQPMEYPQLEDQPVGDQPVAREGTSDSGWVNPEGLIEVG